MHITELTADRIAKAISRQDEPGRYYHNHEHADLVSSIACEIYGGAHTERLWTLRVAGLLHDVCQGPGHEIASALYALRELGHIDQAREIAWLIVAGTSHDAGSLEKRCELADTFLEVQGLIGVGAGEKHMQDMAAALHDADLFHWSSTPITGAAFRKRCLGLLNEQLCKGMTMHAFAGKRRDFLLRTMMPLFQGRCLTEFPSETPFSIGLMTNFERNVQQELDWLGTFDGVKIKLT